MLSGFAISGAWAGDLTHDLLHGPGLRLLLSVPRFIGKPSVVLSSKATRSKSHYEISSMASC